MPRMKSRIKSELANATEKAALLVKIQALYDQRSSRIKFQIGNGARFHANECTDVTINFAAAENNMIFQRPNSHLAGGGLEETYLTAIAELGVKEATDVTCVADTGVLAVGTLDLTTDVVLTSVTLGASRNTNTFGLVVAAAAANPTDTVLVDVTGSAAAIVCTVTPNDGTNNAATPVDLTTAELAELINSGVVVGKTVTLTDTGGLIDNQTATGGDATVLVAAGEGDGVTATFATGADSNLNSAYFVYETVNSGGASVNSRYCWLNVNSEGVDPAPGGTGIEVAIALSDTADTVAGNIRTALAADTKVAITGATSHVIITNLFMGVATNAANGAASPGFTYSITQGVASNLLDTYFVLSSADDAISFYVWFDVNGEGTDPAVADHTAIPVALSAGGVTATAVAAAVVAEVDGVASFSSAVVSASQFKIVNAAEGYSTDVVDTGVTGFTISKQGELEMYDNADIIYMKRLRNKKWLIKLAEDSDAAHNAG